MKIKVHYPIIAFAAAVAGCHNLPSVGPDYKELEYTVPEYLMPDAGYPTAKLTETREYKPAVSNEDSRVEISQDRIAKWWENFDDPLLESLVVNSVSNNVSFRMAQYRLEQANWELLGAYAAFMPKFSVDGGVVRNWSRERTASGRRTRNISDLALDASWEIDIFGGNRRLTEAAYAQAESAGWTVADAWVSLTSQIGCEYINLRTVQELIEVARTNLVLQSETYDILKSRLDSGIGDELAVNQCAYIVEQTRARIPDLLVQEERCKNAIAILAGDVPGALHEDLRPVAGNRDWLVAPQKISALKLDMIRSRPDVKAAERELAAQTARIGVAKAQWFPRLFITGSVGFQSTPKAQKLFTPESFIASLGPSVSWPIFQGGAIYANVKATEARMHEVALKYGLAVENAYGEVRDAYAAYTQEYHRYQSLKSAVKAASDAVTISNDLYKNGLKDFNNVLDAQRSRLQLEEELAVSRGQITINLIKLYKSLGGGLAVSNGE